MLFEKQPNMPDLDLVLNNVLIPRVSFTKFLGLWIDDNLLACTRGKIIIEAQKLIRHVVQEQEFAHNELKTNIVLWPNLQ